MAKKKAAEPELTARQKWLLCLLGEKPPRMSPEMDPIRIMKALFLFAEKAPAAWVPAAARYEFAPYTYGPCSFDVYSDLDSLQSTGLVDAWPVARRSWNTYSLSDRGLAAYRTVKGELDKHAMKYLATLKAFVKSLSFTQLLKVIYKGYPQYAKRSVFRDPAGD